MNRRANSCACVCEPDYWVVLEIDEQWKAKRLDASCVRDALPEATKLAESQVIAVVRLRCSGSAPVEKQQLAAWVLNAAKAWHEDK